MKRKELLDLPIVMSVNELPDVSSKNNYKPNLCYTARVDNSTGDDVLIIDFYDHKTNDFYKRLFLCGSKWFTEFADGSISNASLKINFYGYCSCNYIPFTDTDEIEIKEYVKSLPTFKTYKHISYQFSKHSGIEVVSDYQDIIREERLEEKYQKIRDSISKEMLEIYPTPEKFNKWIDNAVMPHYVFYIYAKAKRVTAYCSHCGETVMIDRPYKGDSVICPNCKVKCSAKPLNAYLNSNGFSDKANAIYIQRLRNDRICIRKYNVFFGYYKSTTPSKTIYECQRTFTSLSNNLFAEGSNYIHDSNYKGGDWRRDYYYDVTTEGYVFPSNLNQIFKKRDGFHQYHIDFNKIARHCNPLNIENLINASVGVSSLMNLVNNKLYDFARDMINLSSGDITVNVNSRLENFRYKNVGALRKAFGITKDDLPILRYNNLTLEEYDCYVKLKRSKRIVSKEELKEYFYICSELDSFHKLTNHIIKYSSIHQFVKFYKRLDSEHFFNSVNVGCFWGCSNPKRYFLSDYFDYIRFANLLEMDLRDLKVLYPKNPKKAHDDLSEIVNGKEFKNGELPQIARQYPLYKRMFGYSSSKFIIVPPKRHNDVKNEGKILDHCVGTYAQRIATEETIILFVRKKEEPDKPFYTLNIDPKDYRQIQCRGLQNCDTTKEVDYFLAKWRRKKIDPLKRSKEKCKKTA